jgi:anti-sigma-K factor RskA
MSTQPPNAPDDDTVELLGAYALDALDETDRARVESYLDESERARAEVDELRETAAMLALTPAPSGSAPAELWDRIAEGIAEHEPARDDTATVVDLASRRRGLSWRIAAPLAAAAAIIIGLLAYQVVDLRGQVDDADAPFASSTLFERASSEAGARELTLAGTSGERLARVVVLPDGSGVLVNDRLAPLDGSETYQLWALVGDAESPTAISAGVLGANPRAAAFKVSGRVVGFALTEEDEPVISSQHDPVALGSLQS